LSEISRIALTIQLLFGTLAATAPERVLADEPQNQSEITVIASGTGADEKAALKQAFSNAVTQAVGMVVDSGTVVKDDQIITDEILTASNAIITRYDPIGKPTIAQGLVTVKIRAVVERKELADRLLAAKVTSARVEGKDMFAQVVTELQNEQDAALVVRRVFEGFPTNVMKAEPVGKLQVVKQSDTDGGGGALRSIGVFRLSPLPPFPPVQIPGKIAQEATEATEGREDATARTSHRGMGVPPMLAVRS